MVETLPKLYREDPDHRIPKTFLSDELFAEAMPAFLKGLIKRRYPMEYNGTRAYEKFNADLSERLKPHFMPPLTAGGHEYTHCQRMISIGKQINFLAFNWHEFVAAVWLHNLDRSTAYRATIENTGLAPAVRNLLLHSPFLEAIRERIIKAVVLHSKKDDSPDDTPLLTALRIADKIDRISASGILTSAAFHGGSLLLYDPAQPFGYDSSQRKPRTIYEDMLFVLEWYKMLPSDDARALVTIDRRRLRLAFLRGLGDEVAERHGVENRVEEDIQRALGPYYEEWQSV